MSTKRAAAFALVRSHKSNFMSLALEVFGGDHRLVVRRRRRRAPARTLDSVSMFCALAGRVAAGKYEEIRNDNAWWLHNDAAWARAARLEAIS
jgi:hypothetical protein